jgi:hypothetical protein
MALALSVTWGFLPVPFAALTRRRARRRRARPAEGSSERPQGDVAVPGSGDDANVHPGAEETP